MVALRVADKAKVLLCGYYGEHNLGDDALLQVLVSQLPDAWHPVITARDHQAVASLVPSASIVNRRSLAETIRALQHVDALVLGGGSLLQDGTSFKSLLYYLILLWSARWNRIPIILWGQGLGPLAPPVEPMVCSGNVGQNPGCLLERPRLVASSPTMAIGHADGDGAGSGLVPSRHLLGPVAKTSFSA